MNSSILVFHADLRDRVNSDSAILKTGVYGETTTQSRSLTCWYLNHRDNGGWSLRKDVICSVDGIRTIHIGETVWRDIF